MRTFEHLEPRWPLAVLIPIGPAVHPDGYLVNPVVGGEETTAYLADETPVAHRTLVVTEGEFVIRVPPGTGSGLSGLQGGIMFREGDGMRIETPPAPEVQFEVAGLDSGRDGIRGGGVPERLGAKSDLIVTSGGSNQNAGFDGAVEAAVVNGPALGEFEVTAAITIDGFVLGDATIEWWWVSGGQERLLTSCSPSQPQTHLFTKIVATGPLDVYGAGSIGTIEPRIVCGPGGEAHASQSMVVTTLAFQKWGE